MATGNSGGTTATSALPKTAPLNAVAQGAGGVYFVNVGTDNVGAPIWSQQAPGYTPPAPNAQTGNQGAMADPSSITDPSVAAMLKQLEGLSSTITSDNSSNSTLYNEITQGQETSNDETDAALKEEEGSAVTAQNQANQAQTEGTAQTAAMLSQYHGVNTALTQFWSDLSTKQASAVATIKGQYDAAIANADSSAASNIQSALLDQIHTNQQQDQQMFNNALSIFSGMTSVLNNQQTQSNATASLNLQQSSLSFQEQQQQTTNATASLSTVLTSLAGDENNTWGNLSSQQQQQLSTLAQAAGMPASVLQTIINSNAKEGVNTASVPGLLGTTILTTDKAGNVINSSYVPMVAAGSQQGQQIIAGQVSWSNSATPGGAGYISSSVLSSLKIGGAAAVAAAQSAYPGSSVKVLDTNQSNKMDSYSSAIPVLGQIAQTVQNDMDLPVDSPSVITGATYNTIQDKLNADLSAIQSSNPGIVEALEAAAGGSTSGFAIRAIVGSDPGALINVNSQKGTILSNLKQISQTIATNANSIVPGYGAGLLDQYPDLGAAQSPGATGSGSSGTGSSSGTSNAGSTDPLGLFGQ